MTNNQRFQFPVGVSITRSKKINHTNAYDLCKYCKKICISDLVNYKEFRKFTIKFMFLDFFAVMFYRYWRCLFPYININSCKNLINELFV